MTTLTCKVPDLLNARLAAAARTARVSKSRLVREVLDRGLTQAARASRPNAYDLVRRLAGALHGPRDLSTNPRHLEGLGA